MTKPELGTKRLCASCNAKFYDLLKTPAVCPMCEAVFVPPKPAPAKLSRRAAEPTVAPVPVVTAPKVEADETEIEGSDVETVELDDADDAEDNGTEKKESASGVPLLEEMDED